MALKPVKTKNAEASPKAEAGAKEVAAATATAAEVDNGILGSMSDKIEFIAPLGDPSHPDTTKDENGNTKTTPYIVGYRFKALEDMTVPECGLGDDAKKNLMSYKDKNGTKQVKKGQEFDLTRFETGMLLAPPEFNGRVTGGGKSYYATFQTTGLKAKNGQVTQTGTASEIPTVSLKAEVGSIKEQKIIEVLTFTSQKLENGTTKKSRTIIKGFEKWEPLCAVAAPRTSAKGEREKTNARNEKAAAFLRIVAAK